MEKTSKHYKYRINEMLGKLPQSDYKKALRVIPKEIGVSVPTFNNYRKFLIDDVQDIPHEKVAMLEIIFGLQPGELQNYTITARPISLIEENGGEEKEKVIKKFNLGK